MMNLLIAIAAGCASALMFASIISGALLSLVLVYLSPLPLMVAALGWGPASALVGGASAGVVLALSFNLLYGLGYVLSVAAPAFWLGHISLLAQPAAMQAPTPRSDETTLDWYPIGRVVLWTALISGLIMMFAMLATGDAASMTAKLREQALQALNALGQSGVQVENKEVVATVMARLLPPVAVGTTTVMYLLNLWLAGRIVRTSHRLRRPWPDLHTTDLPQTAIVALAASLLLSFAGGLVALIAQMVGAALLTAYTIVGFAVLHYLTRFSKARLWWRMSTYGAIVLFVWPLLLMPIVGLLDSTFGLRRRFGSTSGPPPLST